MEQALVILSGGQDSTICLFWAKAQFDVVHALTFVYGQRHWAEIQAAKKVGEMAEVDSHEILNLGRIFKSESPLVSNKKVKEYVSTRDAPKFEKVKDTFIEGRNTLFLSLGSNRAVYLRCGFLVAGFCQVDDDCPDSSLFGVKSDLRVLTPLMDFTKKDSIKLAMQIPGCMKALAYSHTCYEGKVPPCSKCRACLLREQGFEDAKVLDPLVVRTKMKKE